MNELVKIEKIAGLPDWWVKENAPAMKAEYNKLEWTRPDGLKVFFDQHDIEWARRLNIIRVYGTRKQVQFAVGLVKGMLIVKNYADTHGNEEEQSEARQLIDRISTDIDVKRLPNSIFDNKLKGGGDND